MLQTADHDSASPSGGARSVRPPARPVLDVRALFAAALVALVVAGASAGVVLARADVYRSNQVLIIDQTRAISLSGEGVVTKLGMLRQKYAGLLRTEVIVRPVAAATGLPVGDVAGALHAVVPPQSLLLAVQADAHDASQAKRMASAGAEELSRYLDHEQDTAGVATADRITLRTVTSARDGVKVEPTRSRALRAAVVGGLVALGLVYLLGHLLLSRFRD